MSDACARCGHEHQRTSDGKYWLDCRCGCFAFADGARPDDLLCDPHHWYVQEPNRWMCTKCGTTKPPTTPAPADVSDALVKVLAEHRIPMQGGGGTAAGAYCVCSCGERNAPRSGLRDHALALATRHVAQVLSERFVITSRETE